MIAAIAEISLTPLAAGSAVDHQRDRADDGQHARGEAPPNLAVSLGGAGDPQPLRGDRRSSRPHQAATSSPRITLSIASPSSVPCSSSAEATRSIVFQFCSVSRTATMPRVTSNERASASSAGVNSSTSWTLTDDLLASPFRIFQVSVGGAEFRFGRDARKVDDYKPLERQVIAALDPRPTTGTVFFDGDVADVDANAARDHSVACFV